MVEKKFAENSGSNNRSSMHPHNEERPINQEQQE